MWITHSYLGTTKNGTRCLFFLLYEDYIEAQSQFARELELELERFARNLGHAGAVVRPFSGDIDTTRKNILDKSWRPDTLRELRNTPALLMIEVDFDRFDPLRHRWILLNFGFRYSEGIAGAYHFREALHVIAKAVNDSSVDPFEVAHEVQHNITAQDAVKIFEARPGIFGFSIDLIKAGKLIQTLYERHTRNTGSM